MWSKGIREADMLPASVSVANSLLRSLQGGPYFWKVPGIPRDSAFPELDLGILLQGNIKIDQCFLWRTHRSSGVQLSHAERDILPRHATAKDGIRRPKCSGRALYAGRQAVEKLQARIGECARLSRILCFPYRVRYVYGCFPSDKLRATHV